MIIGIDVDGILADFNTAYIKMLTERFGLKLPEPSDTYPNTWSYDQAAGLTKEQERQIWQEIGASKTFWQDLQAYPEAFKFLHTVSNRHDDVYFLTSRPSRTAKWQTERWLKRNGFQGGPTVLISSQKGALCKALKVDLYIEDRNENLVDVVASSPRTVTFRLVRPWNEAIKGTVSGTLTDFQSLIENGVVA